MFLIIRLQNRWDPSEPGVAELLKQGANINLFKYAILCKYVSTDHPWVNVRFHVFYALGVYIPLPGYDDQVFCKEIPQQQNTQNRFFT